MAHFASDGCNLLESPGAIWDCAVFEKHEEAGPLAAMERGAWNRLLLCSASGFFLFFAGFLVRVRERGGWVKCRDFNI